VAAAWVGDGWRGQEGSLRGEPTFQQLSPVWFLCRIPSHLVSLVATRVPACPFEGLPPPPTPTRPPTHPTGAGEYKASLVKAVKRTVTDATHSLVIVDAPLAKADDVRE
jgi:hypothetical protein